VQVNVIALDGEHRSVADLTSADFSITDDGKPQKISVFSMEKSGDHAGGRAALRPNVFSNRPADHPGATTNITLILLDAVNTTFEDQAFARSQVQKFLKKMRPNDLVALYALGRSLRKLHDFSSDADSLSLSLAKYGGEIPTRFETSPPTAASGGGNVSNIQGSPQGPGSTQPLSASALQLLQNGYMEGEYEFMVHQRADQTIGTFAAIANYLGRLPGRKNLIWISGAFPFALGFESIQVMPGRSARLSNDLWREIEHGTRALNNANLAIYPIDARGLEGAPMFSADRRVIDLSTGNLIPGRNEQDTMQELADLTGGRAFYNTNGLAEAIQNALDDSCVSYMLAFYPAHGKWDGRWDIWLCRMCLHHLMI